MIITVKKDLDTAQLYNDIIDDFCEYTACEEIALCPSDITPELLKKIFAALAEEAANRE